MSQIESGYGSSPEVIAKNIAELAKAGVVGINIEDSKVVYGERLLCGEIEFANKLTSIKALLNKMNISMFINVRTDAYLLSVDNALEESIKRIEMYQSAGADGIFLPCIKTLDDISAVVTNTELPINVMCVPDLPDFNILEELGVKRISMGNFLHEAMMDYFSSMLSTIVSEKSFEALFR
ncbi:isocitrate lyase/phosphoenolpyruvate mutase family protein [Shewanella sp. 202IG2-18]|uniref:isocitrate lyase/PEP mutase family protein n=1 Tax=Parashewanella hymeniacidonis TaxID=2807618 RepID=UPI00196001B3|nr:isocitrate lyase/phosphoenolpyruvate mutase family protein [Parashewanella hymeniacidonis]MBM7074697.1 isocitrate lyase/phosphoenolpyruvate mutase family protein [Parashewanella hymeniacidonis]